jgi:hypothetical protein
MSPPPVKAQFIEYQFIMLFYFDMVADLVASFALLADIGN